MDGIKVLEIDSEGRTRELSDDEIRKLGRGPGSEHIDARLKSVKKDATVPKVGDVVRLNDHGLEQIYGSTLGVAHMKTLEMRITQVDDVSMTYPEPTFCVKVDNPDIDCFLIDHVCFDIVRRA